MSAYPLITISRQYAAYGRTVAKGLSERLGIPYYDRDFVKKTAESSGYAEEDIIREGEDISKGSRFWNSFLNNATVYSSSYDGIFAAESKVILELSQEPCIIVGRSANHVLSPVGSGHPRLPCVPVRGSGKADPAGGGTGRKRQYGSAEVCPSAGYHA